MDRGTYDTVIDGISLSRERFVDAMVLNRVNAEHMGLLERPRSNVVGKLPVA